MTGFIDVHAHFVTGSYIASARTAGHDPPDGMPRWPDWSARAHLELMDRTGIDAAVLSVSSPGTHFGDDAAARRLAREVNDAGAQVVRDHPGRFGLFASLPLPDIDGALAEIGYAFDTLDADGVIMETNVHGVYLGDQRLEPVFAELARCRATVFLHPMSPPCWEQTALGRPRPMIEFIFDTARAVTDLILAGTLDRHPQAGERRRRATVRRRFVPTSAGGSRVHPDDPGPVRPGMLVASVLLLLISNEAVSRAAAGTGHRCGRCGRAQ